MYTEVINELESIVANKDKQKRLLEEKIEELNNGLQEKEEKCNNASEKCDFKEFKKYKTLILECENEIQMYKNKLNQLYNSELVSESEANELRKRIYSIQEKVTSDKKEKFAELLRQVGELADEIVDEFEEGNLIFAKYSNDIKYFKAIVGNSSAGVIYANRPERNTRNEEFARYVKNYLMADMYEVITQYTRKDDKPRMF